MEHNRQTLTKIESVGTFEGSSIGGQTLEGASSYTMGYIYLGGELQSDLVPRQRVIPERGL